MVEDRREVIKIGSSIKREVTEAQETAIIIGVEITSREAEEAKIIIKEAATIIVEITSREVIEAQIIIEATVNIIVVITTEVAVVVIEEVTLKGEAVATAIIIKGKKTIAITTTQLLIHWKAMTLIMTTIIHLLDLR